MSLRTAASQSVTGIAETSLRALAKLEQVLPARLRDAAAALRLATVALPAAAAAVDPDLLTALLPAGHRLGLARRHSLPPGPPHRRRR